MKILYTIGILFYGLGVRVASLFNIKARQMCRGWKGQFKRIPETLRGGKVAWFHASSLGEFEQARPVLETFRGQHPEYKVVLTFFSPSGYEIRKNYNQADYVCYLPLDTPCNARRFVEAINPKVAYFVKYDFWFNYLIALRKKGVPCFIFSAIFRPTQYFFKWYGGWFRRRLGDCYTHLFVQNEASEQLLKQHGIANCSVAGDTRFDRVHAIAEQAKRFDAVERFVAPEGQARPVLMAGSSWEPDEEQLARYLRQAPGDLRYVLAPHVLEEKHLQFIETLFGTDNCCRYSWLVAHPEAPVSARVLIIDNMGMLSALYRYATVAYIGGGWGHGIHNTLEAVTFGKPVVFGPRYQKFQEAHDLLRCGGGFTYDKYETLEQTLNRLFSKEEDYRKSSEACLAYLQSNLGSTRTILDYPIEL